MKLHERNTVGFKGEFDSRSVLCSFSYWVLPIQSSDSKKKYDKTYSKSTWTCDGLWNLKKKTVHNMKKESPLLTKGSRD